MYTYMCINTCITPTNKTIRNNLCQHITASYVIMIVGLKFHSLNFSESKKYLHVAISAFRSRFSFPDVLSYTPILICILTYSIFYLVSLNVIAQIPRSLWSVRFTYTTFLVLGIACSVTPSRSMQM